MLRKLGMSRKKFKVVISQYVYDSILAVYRGICHESLSGADHVRRALISGMESLRDFPERYLRYETEGLRDRQLRKMVILKRYLVFYEVVGEEVRIYHVVDGKRDYAHLL